MRVDGSVVSDKGLKLGAGTYVVASGQAQVRPHHPGVSMRRRAVLLWGASLAATAWAAPNPAEQARIERLIQFVEEQKDIRFVRNGSAYSPKDAAKFLRRKFEKMGEQCEHGPAVHRADCVEVEHQR